MCVGNLVNCAIMLVWIALSLELMFPEAGNPTGIEAAAAVSW